MNDIEKIEYINSLFDIYKELLTDKQRQIMEKYYIFNLSLAEISEELLISRNAVSDTINHAIKKLENYEEKLKIFRKRQLLIKKIEESNLTKEEKENILDEVIYGI